MDFDVWSVLQGALTALQGEDDAKLAFSVAERELRDVGDNSIALSSLCRCESGSARAGLRGGRAARAAVAAAAARRSCC
jgi:hypothetical protein